MQKNLVLESLRRWIGITDGGEPPSAARPDPEPSAISPYAISWDQYVKDIKPKDGQWPGDEWGNEEFWQLTFKRMFVEQGAEHWRHSVEIGAGSGKYTQYLLDHSATDIVAFDISPEFLNVLRTRLAEPIRAGRLIPELLRAEKCSEMHDWIRQRGWLRQVDAFYSIDAMVHVDLQYLIAYIATAALVLRPGGKLIMSLADATTDGGFRYLLDGIKPYYAMQSRTGGKFEFMSRDLICSVLERVGFVVQFIPELSERDAYFAATLSDLSPANILERALLG
jgi:SAM-dependent methyltransferase